LQKSQQFRFTHRIPLFTLQRLMMREIHQPLALNSFFAVQSTKKRRPNPRAPHNKPITAATGPPASPRSKSLPDTA
jgi:hypothetical protein